MAPLPRAFLEGRDLDLLAPLGFAATADMAPCAGLRRRPPRCRIAASWRRRWRPPTPATATRRPRRWRPSSPTPPPASSSPGSSRVFSAVRSTRCRRRWRRRSGSSGSRRPAARRWRSSGLPPRTTTFAKWPGRRLSAARGRRSYELGDDPEPLTPVGMRSFGRGHRGAARAPAPSRRRRALGQLGGDAGRLVPARRPLWRGVQPAPGPPAGRALPAADGRHAAGRQDCPAALAAARRGAAAGDRGRLHRAQRGDHRPGLRAAGQAAAGRQPAVRHPRSRPATGRMARRGPFHPARRRRLRRGGGLAAAGHRRQPERRQPRRHGARGDAGRHPGHLDPGLRSGRGLLYAAGGADLRAARRRPTGGLCPAAGAGARRPRGRQAGVHRPRAGRAVGGRSGPRPGAGAAAARRI